MNVWRQLNLRASGAKMAGGICLFFAPCFSVLAMPWQADSNQSAGRSMSIEQLWKTKVHGIDNASKDAPGERLQTLVAILDSSPKAKVENEYRALTSASVELSEYQEVLLQAFVFTLTRDRTEDRLEQLLADRCPQVVGLRRIEFFLATSRLNNPVALLVAAYRRSSNETSRDVILAALTSAFKTLRSRFQPTNEFLDHMVKWYEDHRKSIRINPDYASSDEDGELYIVIDK